MDQTVKGDNKSRSNREQTETINNSEGDSSLAIPTSQNIDPPDGSGEGGNKKKTPTQELLDRIRTAELSMIGLTALIFLTGVFQACESHRNNKATGDQVDQVIKSTWDIKGSAQSFSNSAWSINQGISGAVAKLQLQAEQTERSARAAEDALKATQTQMRLDERAWLGFGNLTVVLNNTDPLKVDVVVSVFGKSPAINIASRVDLRSSVVGHEIQLQDIVFNYGEMYGGTAYPGSNFPLHESFPLSEGPKAMVDSVLKKREFLYFFGETTYKDIFLRPHWPHFCYMIPTADVKDAQPCKIYNDSDADHPTK
jgi:hypothetical protein